MHFVRNDKGGENALKNKLDMQKHILWASLAALCMLPLAAGAQRMRSDAERAGFKSDVNTVREVTRGTHGQIMGYPTTYYYNAVGNYSRVVYSDTLGKEQMVVRYTYDTLGRLVKDGRYRTSDGALLSESTYDRDRRDRTFTVSMHSEQASSEDRLVYTYDKQGNVVDVSSYDKEGRQQSRDYYKYDSHGMVSEIQYTEGPDENYRRTERFRYDSDGNVMECRTLYISTERQRLCYTYDFDRYGNWVRRAIYNVTGNTAELMQVTTREIAYFE